jgi:hypothetical protein
MLLTAHGDNVHTVRVKNHTQDDHILGRLQIHFEHNKVKAFLALITAIETWDNNALQVGKVMYFLDDAAGILRVQFRWHSLPVTFVEPFHILSDTFSVAY